MNIAFFLGKEVEQGRFRFIVDKRLRHKSQYDFKCKLQDGNIVDMIAYDEVADYIVQKRPINMLIQGVLKNENEQQIYVEISSIQGLTGDFCKHEFEKQ